MFIDFATITAQAGNGGDGSISFRREKYVPRGGPDGGDGGRGGHVIAVAHDKMSSLSHIRSNGSYKAESGVAGGKARSYGAAGKDIVIKVPPGTLIADADTGEFIAELLTAGEKYVITRGGMGGRGNIHFATPQNRVPQHAEPGIEGEVRRVTLDYAIPAHAALIGLPGSGKSSLLQAITNAKPTVGDYDFTTQGPVIGVCNAADYSSIKILDLPALCAGASGGRGLGARFLRHLRHVSLLIIVLDATAPEPPGQQWEILRAELESANPEALGKNLLFVLNKIDGRGKKHRKDDSELPGECLEISTKTNRGMDNLKSAIAGNV